MKRLSDVIIIGLLIVSGYFSWTLFFKAQQQVDTVAVQEFPMEIAGWTSIDIPLTEKEFAILETRNLFIRKYTSPDGKKEVMLYIIYSQTNRKVSHPPEMCFAGGGMMLVEHKPKTIPTPMFRDGLTLNRMHWQKERTSQLVYHWYKAGDDFTESYWGQQGQVALKALLRQNSSTAMIRLSTPYLAEGDLNQADANLEEFAQLILPLLPKYIP